MMMCDPEFTVLLRAKDFFCSSHIRLPLGLTHPSIKWYQELCPWGKQLGSEADYSTPYSATVRNVRRYTFACIGRTLVLIVPQAHCKDYQTYIVLITECND
jgi:hypothetical protein